MNSYYVAADDQGSYERPVSAVDAHKAAEEWAAWYCTSECEYDLEYCFVRPIRGSWEKFNIEIESVPHFHASKAA